MTGRSPQRPSTPDERALIDARPSPWYLLVRGVPDALPGVIVAVAARLSAPLLAGAAAALDDALAGAVERWLGVLAVLGWAYAGLRVLWAGLDWLSRRHVLTEARLSVARGVVRTVRVDVALSRLEHLVVTRGVLERLFGVGTVAAASAGTDVHEVVWRSVADPDDVMAMIRDRAQRVARGDDGGAPVPVIGLVGGIGSGKSTVAGVFERLGCVRSDSDAAVREVLSRRAVIDQLVAWWGRAVLDADGNVDRARVADVVFADANERRRLESLVHPLVGERRAADVARARAAGARGVVVDAPLLFEADVDAECDAVVFVDASRATRLGRVRADRGWDEAEFARRENAQMPLEQKRSRSDHVIVNDGPVGDLHESVARVLDAVSKDFRPE